MKPRNILRASALLALVVLFAYSCGNAPRAGIDSTALPLESPVRVSFFANSISATGALATQGAGDLTGLLVTDYLNSAVSLLDPASLEVLASFPITGRALSVATMDDKVYVGNDITGSVEVYDWLGGKLYNLGFAEGNVLQPQDIALDPGDGLLFVADGGGDDVKVFQSDGTFVRSITGTGPSLLVNPTAVAVDAVSDLLFVSDYGVPVFDLSDFDPPPPRVIVFDYLGNFQKMISGEGVYPESLGAGYVSMDMSLVLPTESYGFSRPQGIALDGGLLYVADAVRGVVLVFDVSGSPAGVKVLGEFGPGAGQLMLPLDVVVDPATKDVFVTDNRNARVEVFRAGGLIP